MKKSVGRYEKENRKAEKKASSRKYTSYEDVPLEDYRETAPVQGNVTKKFIKLFLILFFSVVLVIALLNIDKLTPDNVVHWFQYDLLGKTEGEGYPTSFSGTTVSTGNFSLLSGVPAYCSDTTITVLNNNAGTYLEKQHSYANPVLAVNKGWGMVYNPDGTGYTVFKRDSIVRTDSVKYKIISGDIASNGVYALLTENDDYLSKLTVYRSSGQEKYTYSFAEYYMNSVSLNSDGSRAVLSGVSARNGALISVIYVLDLTQSSYMQKYEADETYIYEIKYFDNGNALAVGSNMAFFINIGDGKKSDISYSAKTLTSYTLSRENGVLLSLSVNPDGRECDVLPVDTEGKLLQDISTGSKILSMDSYRNNTAVLTDGKLTVYDKSGGLKSEKEVDPDSRKLLFSDEKNLYLLGKSRISKVTL